MERPKEQMPPVGAPEGERPMIEIVGSLNEALRTRDLDGVIAVLKDDKTRERIVIEREGREKNAETGGEDDGKNRYLISMNKGFAVIIEERFKGKRLSELTEKEGVELIGYVKETGLSERVFVDMAAVAYHLRDADTLFFLLRLMEEHKSLLDDGSIYPTILHHCASLYGSTGHKTLALAENKIILRMAKDIGDPNLAAKTEYGRLYNLDSVAPGRKAEDYVVISDRLSEAGNVKDSISSRISAAAALAARAKEQLAGNMNDRSLAEKNIEKALVWAHEALAAAKTMKFFNGEVKAWLAIQVIEGVAGRTQKAKKAGKTAEKIKGGYEITPLY